MHDEQVDALLEAAEDGPIGFDDLTVTLDADGYSFRTPDVERTGLSTAGVHEAAEEAPWYVSNWYFWTHGDGAQADHQRAFLRWIENAQNRGVRERYEILADGVRETWGQLQVTAALGDHGRRRYEVRHVADDDVEPERLTTHTDLSALRELVTYDSRGRYRPLKTAPTLQRGWIVPDLDAGTLVETIDRVYPATIANWHLERNGQLDVTHWDDAAARQTGIYDVVEELEGDAVDWIAEACCVDSQCLKRRVWQRDAETPLSPPGGDGKFPCREPCSLVIAAARKWALLEREATRTYEFELTPSEKSQLEAIVEAVADGRVDDIREADVGEGANRYRVRYLRAKRFDEEGRLSGVRTDPDRNDVARSDPENETK